MFWKKILIIILVVVLIGVFITSPSVSAKNAVTESAVKNLMATVAPPFAGKSADYLIIFNSYSMLEVGDHVDIIFPAGTQFPDPDQIKQGWNKVFVNNYPSGGVDLIDNKSKNELRVRIPTDVTIDYGGECKIEFTTDFGIKNPLQPGKYTLKLYTSKDKDVVESSPPYVITGTSIKNLNVLVNPSSQGVRGEYKVTFTTSGKGPLTAGKDKIYIKFPQSTGFPASVVPGAVLLNGEPCTNIVLNKSTKTIVITVVSNISSNDDVSIVITQDFGIVNPSATGKYKLGVYTSSDANLTEANLVITPSSVSNISVVLSTHSAGAVCSYEISFKTGASGALTAGIDKINIIFPVGTTILDSIPISSVTINNIPPTYIKIFGTTITLTVPSSVPANSIITVVFSNKAEIKNPVKGGTYFLYVNTSKETTSVKSSNYIIYNTPITKATIIPSTPDGNNGFYKTQPVVTFSSISAIDPNPVIYYYFDNNPPIAYNGEPIKVPEGVHMLYYYAIDNKGNQEAPLSMKIKVDSVPPQIVVDSPKDGAVLSNRDVTISGTVELHSVVRVNDKDVTVDDKGHFSTVVHISSNSGVIDIKATDLAGNVAEKVLHVSIDTTPPVITVSSPIQFQVVHKLPLLVTGKVEKGASVFVNGASATVDVSGAFLYKINSFNNEGIQTITVVAKDAAGNETKVDISIKYIKTTVIKLQVTNKVALINSETKTLDSPPIIKNSRTLVPLRFVSEAFGIKPIWDSVFKIIDMKFENKFIRLQVGKGFASVNGTKVSLDVPPIIISGRTMVPIRFIAEAFNAKVVWDSETRTITIIYPKP